MTPESAVQTGTSADLALDRFFLPGPTAVHPDVLAAMDRSVISHRGSDIQTLILDIDNGLRPVFGTKSGVFIGTCSGTGFMEAAVLNGVRSKLLALVNGAFSERFAVIAEACGAQVERLTVPWGDVHDPNAVVAAMRRFGPDSVSFVHSETSTGALQDIPSLTAAVRSVDADVAILVDSVSGAGGAELRVDEWGIDFLATAGHKAIALPPGLAFGVASEAMMRRSAASERKGFYFDLERYAASAAKSQTPTTPAVPLLYAAHVQADRIASEGMPRRIARHAAMADVTWSWASDRGLDVVAPESARSPTVTCLTLPSGRTGPEVTAAVADRGWTITTGYGQLKESTIRIGHMGEHTVEQTREVLAVVDEVLAR